MSLTLELPPDLSRLLAAEAEKAGISMQEHATHLLALVIALLYRDAGTWSSLHAFDTRHLLSTLECSANEQGSGETTSGQFAEAQALLASLGYGQRTGSVPTAAQTHSAMGRYAHLGARSEGFSRAKRGEIEVEDRRKAS
ncbi:MAG: hypothetical protein ACJ8GN_31390 [Longimicrobiaceae bacterium]